MSPTMLSHTQLSLAPETVKVTVRPARIIDLPALVDLLCQLFSIETDFAVRPTRHARGLRLLLGAVRRGRAYVALAESRALDSRSLWACRSGRVLSAWALASSRVRASTGV